MKRRVKRVKRDARMATGTMGVAALIVTGVIMTMIYFSADSRCGSITKEIGRCEKRLAALDAELARVNVRWEEMKTPERLEVQLKRFGVEMTRPREDQLVRMDESGRPVPGQLAVARAMRRSSQVVARNVRKR